MLEEEKFPVIVDTHIHLFPASEIDQLAWQTPAGPLHSQHSLDDYTNAVTSTASLCGVEETSAPVSRGRCKPTLHGFVFVETDRKSGLDPSKWFSALNEIKYLRRVAEGHPRLGEGHEAKHAHLCKAIIPWAPIPAGVEPMNEYRRLAQEAAGEAYGLIRGWRYLIQDKDCGVMLQESFIKSLRALGERNEVFELGIDYHKRGEEQLLEAIECLEKVYDGVATSQRVRVVISEHAVLKGYSVTNARRNTDHMCKPKMHDSAVDCIWGNAIKRLACFPGTYVKLSGGFSEIAPLPPIPSDERRAAYEDAVKIIHMHMDEVWNAFGSARCMFGSDWPVCNVGLGTDGKENTDAWASWTALALQWTKAKNLSDEQTRAFFGGVAAQVYGIEL